MVKPKTDPWAPSAATVWLVDLLVLAGTWAMLLFYFRPEFLFSISTTTGGDTSSHFYTAWYTSKVLLPQGKILGWIPGNLAGYPIFQFYFPLPFLVIALLNLLMPLEIAFKLVTAMGAFLMPLGAWAGLRLARSPFPGPALAAVFALLFLFNDTQSMWGGNIPSLMAGEFGYSIGLALTMVYLGSLHRDMEDMRHPALNGFLLALVGFCHGCTLLVGVLVSGFWLFHPRFVARGFYLAKVFVMAVCLMGFWMVPLFVFADYNTLHNQAWYIDKWQKAVPPILFPLMGLCLIHLAYSLWQRIRGKQSLRLAGFFLGSISLSLVLYLVALHLNVIDIRFFPFAWLAVCLWAGAGAGVLCQKLAARALIPLIVLVITVAGIGMQVTFIPGWIKWNYMGFENAAGWHDFAELNRWLAGKPGDPRVLHEHSDAHRRLGSTRAFEDLPYFANRSTLEGLYVQSSVNTPFIFYLQSLTTQTATTPIASYIYSRFDLARAIPRMILYNVRDYVVVDAKTKAAAQREPGLKKAVEIGPYEVYQVVDNPGTYAVPLRYKPVLAITKDWKRLAHKWFRLGDLEVPLVFKKKEEPGDRERFAAVWHDELGQAPRIPLPDPGPIQEEVSLERMVIHTPNQAPLYIKSSYHPNWLVTGAKRVYMASPAFMVVYPDSDTVVLRFGRSWPNHVGMALSGLALLVLICGLPAFRDITPVTRVNRTIMAPVDWLERGLERLLARPLGFLGRNWWWTGALVVLLVAAGCVAYIELGGKEDALTAYRRAVVVYEKGDMDKAEKVLRQAWDKYPNSNVVNHIANYHARTFYRRQMWAEALVAYKELIERLPDTPQVPEAWYHVGLCELKLGHPELARQAFEKVIHDYAYTGWDNHARARLREMKN